MFAAILARVMKGAQRAWTVALEFGRDASPIGATENSPAIHRGVEGARWTLSPVGTAEPEHRTPRSAVPTGLEINTGSLSTRRFNAGLLSRRPYGTGGFVDKA